MTEDEVAQAFAPLKGRYAWGARAGGESIFSFEVGEPRLEIVEHHDLRGELRREVVPRGRHHFALLDCRFELAFDGATAATDEHGRGAVMAAAERLSGQALEEVVWQGGVLQLRFDLGASLRVWRHPQSELGAAVWELDVDSRCVVWRA